MRGLWLLLLLAGCAAVPVTPPPAPPEPAPVEAAPEPLAPPKPRVEELLGLDPALSIERLGLPALVRRDDDVQIHQYRAPGCVLDLVFFEEEQGPFRLRHVAARDIHGASLDPQACYEVVLSE